MTSVNLYGGASGSGAVGFFEQFQGSDFSGSSGNVNRTVTLADTPATSGTAVLYVQGRILHKTQEYSISGTTLTVIGALYDDDYVDVWY